MLIEAGYRVEGLFMKNWEEDDGTEYCTAKEDLADAQSVADQLGIRLHSANFAAEYWDCLLYTSPSPRDISGSRMPSSA